MNGEPTLSPSGHRFASGVLLVAALTAACTGTASDGGRTSTNRATPARYYAVGWDPRVYDARTSGRAFAACTSLPGAAEGGTKESLPPINSLVFTGTDEQRKVVEGCLNSLPGGRVTTR